MKQKQNKPMSYDYETIQQVRFEMELRATIVASAKALSQSGLGFEKFKKAKCNEQLWTLTEQGGFLIRDDSTPAIGIRDIFANGSKYATECATAAVIVAYKGILDSIQENEFNRLFSGLLLYDWHIQHNLLLSKQTAIKEALPGDLLYFNNPDFSAETPIWRGENAVMVGDDLYYGHPFGIVSSNKIISKLNKYRKPDSNTSAYLTDEIVYPDYVYLSQFALDVRPIIFARIGCIRYVV
ncbi:protein-glutamine gamma-glutamyltransferase [Paenibacillus sp. N3.4]|nr:protein-glutamine gamma-glutamyltransferase [Paenibacillus sp. N3.4]